MELSEPVLGARMDIGNSARHVSVALGVPSYHAAYWCKRGVDYAGVCGEGLDCGDCAMLCEKPEEV